MQQMHILGETRMQYAAAKQQVTLVPILFDELKTPAVIPAGHLAHDRFICREGSRQEPA